MALTLLSSETLPPLIGERGDNCFAHELLKFMSRSKMQTTATRRPQNVIYASNENFNQRVR